MSPHEDPDTGASRPADASGPGDAPGPGIDEREPVNDVVALRRAPVEDADLALISPYHEDPEALALAAHDGEAPAARDGAEPPPPDHRVDDPGERSDPPAQPTAPGGEAPAARGGAEPPLPDHLVDDPYEPVGQPAAAPALPISDGAADEPAAVDVDRVAARPGAVAPSDVDVAAPMDSELAAPTDVDVPSGAASGPGGQEPLRAAETPDVAVAVAPLRLPPSYPPVHRPEPLPAPARAGEQPEAEREPRRWGGTIGVVLVVLLISALLKTFVVQTFTIPSSSMESTLMTGDRVAVSVWDADDVRKGDIIVFKDPDHWLDVQDPTGFRAFVQDALILIHLLPEDSGHHLIKRVIGTAGDHVVSDGTGRITVNGVAVDETYLDQGESPSQVAFDVTVPDGYLWVMGDNRANSADSRYHQTDAHQGFVPVEDVVGVARDVIWPITQWSDVQDGTTVFDTVPAPSGEAPSPATPAAEDGA